MTQLLVKRCLSKIQPGDVLIRPNGERCKVRSITPCVTVHGRQTLRYRFFGFDVLRPAMCWMFSVWDDMSDDLSNEYIPHPHVSYTASNGRVMSCNAK